MKRCSLYKQIVVNNYQNKNKKEYSTNQLRELFFLNEWGELVNYCNRVGVTTNKQVRIFQT